MIKGESVACFSSILKFSEFFEYCFCLIFTLWLMKKYSIPERPGWEEGSYPGKSLEFFNCDKNLPRFLQDRMVLLIRISRKFFLREPEDLCCQVK